MCFVWFIVLIVVLSIWKLSWVMVFLMVSSLSLVSFDMVFLREFFLEIFELNVLWVENCVVFLLSLVVSVMCRGVYLLKLIVW